jgi:hypothetical protein
MPAALASPPSAPFFGRGEGNAIALNELETREMVEKS